MTPLKNWHERVRNDFKMFYIRSRTGFTASCCCGLFIATAWLFLWVCYTGVLQADGTASPFNSTSPGTNGTYLKSAAHAKEELSRTQSKVRIALAPSPLPTNGMR